MNARNGAIAIVLVSMVALMGCPSKKPAATGALGAGSSMSGSDLGGSRGSLDEFGRSGLGSSGGPLADVQYDYDSFDLNESARMTLRSNAEWLKANMGARVEIEGHCDERGTVEYNLALGAKRAKSARDYLVTLGVSADRLSTISYGEELPLCREMTESCYAQNRRAHFVVLQ
jgi:peptidoglycan-associated lipoprotein